MVDAKTGDLAARFVEGVGVAECPLSTARKKMASYLRGFQAGFQFVASTADCSVALEYLSALTFPETRHVLFAPNGQFTAFVHNSRNGSDYADYAHHVPRHLNCRFARVVNTKQRVWTNGRRRQTMGHAARIFELHDSDGETIRSVVCMNDGGRWVFHSYGAERAVEASFPYTANRTSDRFTSHHLGQLARAFGFPLPDGKQLCDAGEYHLFSQDRGRNIESCTIAEADDPAYWQYICGMGWVPHMKTHATSVISSFERCVELNPEYEPRVRRYLEAARQQVARDVES